MADLKGLHRPLTQMNFVVSVPDNGTTDKYKVTGIAAFSEVGGLAAEVDIIEFRQGNSSSMAPVKLPGLVKHGNVTLKMGYVSGQTFKDWVVACTKESRADPIPRKDVQIEMIDISGGTPTAIMASDVTGNQTWVLKNAWVHKYTGPNLNASVSDVAVEEIELAYEELVVPGGVPKTTP